MNEWIGKRVWVDDEDEFGTVVSEEDCGEFVSLGVKLDSGGIIYRTEEDVEEDFPIQTHVFAGSYGGIDIYVRRADA